MTLRIEPTKESELATEAGLVRTVWGFVHENEEPRCVYFARWNDDALADGITFYLSFGEWHDGSTPATRRGVGVLARKHKGSLAFMVIDAADTDFADNEALGHPLSRAEVMDSPYASGAFAVLDRIVEDDERVLVLRDRIERAPAT